MKKLLIAFLILCSTALAQIDSWTYCEYVAKNLKVYYGYDLIIDSVLDEVTTPEFASLAMRYSTDRSVLFESIQTPTVIGFTIADYSTGGVAVGASTWNSNIVCVFVFDTAEKS